jgi:hypothetical protein
MKKLVFLGCLIVFLPAIGFGQEKVDAPVWNEGDKWTFSGDGSIQVIKADPKGYILKFSEKICIFESQGCGSILFDKSTLNRMNVVNGEKRKKYTLGLRKIFDFPLGIGRDWKYAYSAMAFFGFRKGKFSFDYSEHYSVAGWEEVEVRAGKFKDLRLEYKRVVTGSSSQWSGGIGDEIKNQYWYSPAVKYFVKCQYDKDWSKENKEVFSWELTSFQLKK